MLVGNSVPQDLRVNCRRKLVNSYNCRHHVSMFVNCFSCWRFQGQHLRLQSVAEVFWGFITKQLTVYVWAFFHAPKGEFLSLSLLVIVLSHYEKVILEDNFWFITARILFLYVWLIISFDIEDTEVMLWVIFGIFGGSRGVYTLWLIIYYTCWIFKAHSDNPKNLGTDNLHIYFERQMCRRGMRGKTTYLKMWNNWKDIWCFCARNINLK